MNFIKKLFKSISSLESQVLGSPKNDKKNVKYPGIFDAVDGNTAIIHVEKEASDAAGAYPITPSTQMGEYWAEAVAQGHINVSDHPLIFVEPESEHAAAAVTAGMSMSGLRAVNFSSSQGVAFMHESLYPAVGKRLPYVLNMGCRAITKTSLNVHCSHDDYHCIDDTGFIQMMAINATEAADLNLIARKTAELSLTPAIVGQDGFLTTHLIESCVLPERELVEEFLGRPDDLIDTPTPAQKIIFGDKRRRVPAVWDVDVPVATGIVQNQDAYMQSVAAQRPYFFDHIEGIAEQCMEEYAELTGRKYNRISTYLAEDADYLLVGMGSLVVQAQCVAEYLRETRGIKVGVVNITMFRPFPGDLIGHVLKGKKGVAVLERTDQPLAEDLPIMREIKATVIKCVENSGFDEGKKPYPDYASYAPNDLPRLYSGCVGLGSRDMQPEAMIGAVENMLPDGAQRKFFYLSIDFARTPLSTKDEIHQQNILDAYPKIKELTVRGSENPNLLPKGAITVRMHSIGGWGAITTGKNLAVTLYELLGYHLKANPKYGSEKKGQPTTYYLSVAPEPIRINCEYVYVDVVLSPDPNALEHSNPLSGLKKGGVFIIQSNRGDKTWASFPLWAQRFIIENEIRVFYLDAFQIAREEAGTPDLQLRMQGNVFQGAFFKASNVMKDAKLSESRLFDAIRQQLDHKFGKKGQNVVDNNFKVVKRGYEELIEITKEQQVLGTTESVIKAKELGLPTMMRDTPEMGDGSAADVHRFWEQTGYFYATGKGNDTLADPFIGMGMMPAVTGIFRDMTGIRFEHPLWIAENCTACGNCYTVCPDSAIPGLVSTVQGVFETVINRIEKTKPTRYLRKSTRTVEKKLRAMISNEQAPVRSLITEAINATIAEAQAADQEKMREEFNLFAVELGDFQLAITKPYWSNKEKKSKGDGGLFSITVNPITCKGCALCVDVCDDDALKMITQTEATTAKLRKDWDFWLSLPTTPAQFSRIDSLDEKIGALDTLLLDKHNYASMSCGDGACLGCGEKTAIHLFTSTVTALMQPRVAEFVKKLDNLIEGLEKRIRLKVTESMDVSDTKAIMAAVDASKDGDLTLSKLSDSVSAGKPAQPIDPIWMRTIAKTLEQLKDLRWRYLEGPTKRGRREMGIVNSTGCTSVWASTWPYNPYPFPWTNHLFQDSPSVAMGIFSGHMRKMADGFKAVRLAELELEGKYNAEIHDDFLRRFDWHQFSQDEWLMCPPVVSIGGDGAMYDIGFQNLSRALMSGMPIKVLICDTQVYSNTGGQACTSGFIGQVSDMASFGKAQHGKEEIRKEISLIAMAHRTSFVLQSTIAHVNHLLEGYIDGLNSRRPALFNIYTVCPPEHGIADDVSVQHSKLACEGRAYPLFRFDPDLGTTFAECSSLEGNPAIESDWPKYTLRYLDADKREQTMELPLTFADFAVTEGRFSKHFRKAPQETWNGNMVLLADFVAMSEDEREGLFPYIWMTDSKNQLVRMMVSAEVVRATEERLQFWHQLKDLSGFGRKEDDDQLSEEQLAQRIRAELIAKVTGVLNGNVAVPSNLPLTSAVSISESEAVVGSAAPSLTADADFDAAYVNSPDCTACDECMNIAPKVFKYNDKHQAMVFNPKGAKFVDIVKAAEKCPASCIHPGTAWDKNEPNIAKLQARADKFND